MYVCVCVWAPLSNAVFPTHFSNHFQRLCAAHSHTHIHTRTPVRPSHSSYSFAVVARPRRRRRRLLRCRHLSRSRVCAKVFPRVDVDFPFFCCCCFCVSHPREKFVVSGSAVAADFSELYMLT